MLSFLGEVKEIIMIITHFLFSFAFKFCHIIMQDVFFYIFSNKEHFDVCMLVKFCNYIKFLQ